MAYKNDVRDLIPIPNQAYLSNCDGRVYVKSYDIDGEHRVTVGRMAQESGMMYPNAKFSEWFGEQYLAHYSHRKIYPQVLHIGLYMIFLAIAYKLGLYQALCTAFGVQRANAIMDFAIFSIVTHSNVAQSFPDYMSDQMLFSKKCYSDSWYSDLFSNMTESEIHEFKCLWYKTCENLGIRSCWAVIDGSNSDSDMQDSSLAEHGNPKSRDRSSNIIGYSCAICGEGEYRKLPITYFITPGGMVDTKAFEEIIDFFGEGNVILRGFILDRAYPVAPVINSIRTRGYDFLIMLKSNMNSYKEAVVKCSDMLWNGKYYLAGKKKFGKVCTVSLFDRDDGNSYACVFQDLSNGADRAVILYEKYFKEIERVQKAIQANKSVSVNKELSKYIQIDHSGPVPKMNVNLDLLNEDAFGKGVSVIGLSCFMTPGICDETYNLRDVSEKQHSTMKTQVGSNVFRAHSDQCAESRLLVTFVATVLRSQFEVACEKYKLPTNVAINKLNAITVKMNNNTTYYPVFNIYGPLKKVLGEFDIKEKDLSFFANLANNRMKVEIQRAKDVERKGEGEKKDKHTAEDSKEKSHYESASEYNIPPFAYTTTAKKASDKTGVDTEVDTNLCNEESPADSQFQEKRRGRPPGRKNAKTLERMQREGAVSETEKPKRKPGRPKGSKNRKTLEREAAEAAAKREKEAAEAAAKREKEAAEAAAKCEMEPTEDAVTLTTVAHDPVPYENQNSDSIDLSMDEKADMTHEVTAPRRGPGRPRGSKNKPKSPEDSAPSVKRGRGRPLGSKNKKTLEREAAAAASGEVVVKRGRGRPLGSKNKKTLEREAAAAAAGETVVKRGRGRPVGSKNKKTLEREAAAKAAGITIVKRKPGRPVGSKNKPKPEN